jgi:hypothetical protein
MLSVGDCGQAAVPTVKTTAKQAAARASSLFLSDIACGMVNEQEYLSRHSPDVKQRRMRAGLG